MSNPLARCTWSLAIGVGLIAVSLTGCSAAARRKILTVVFDGVTTTPPPPTSRIRQDLRREVDELTRQLEDARAELKRLREHEAGAQEPAATPSLPVEQAPTWEEAVKLLPSTEGEPDWSQALREGVIAPKPGTEPQAPRQPVMPLDVELVPESDPTYKVVFSHESHTAWLSCANCHPAIFQMRRGADPITMEQISAGQSCGVCHGTVAFSAERCTRCHRGLAE